MPNAKNLKPAGTEGGHSLTREEQVMGGQASARKRRMQGAIERALDTKASADFKEILAEFNVDEDDKTFASALACVLVKKAAQGNLEAIAMVRDTIGEKPKDEIELGGGVLIVDDLN